MQNNNKLISIVIPVRNDSNNEMQDYLDKCIASFKVDDKFDERLEFIVVDDASPTPIQNNFPDIVQLIRSDKHVHVGGARNIGVDTAKGKFIWCVDADDFVNTVELKNTIDSVEKNTGIDCIFITANNLVIDPKTNKQVIREHQKNIFTTFEQRGGYAIAPWAKIIKKEKFVKFPENMYLEDLVWHYYQMDNVSSVIYLKNLSYIWNRTRKTAYTRTCEFFARNSMTLEAILTSDILHKNKLKDETISALLHGIAQMWDARNTIRDKNVNAAMRGRMMKIWNSLLAGHWLH